MASKSKKGSKPTGSVAPANLSGELQQLDQLAELMNRRGITEFEWESKGEKVKVRIGSAGQSYSMPVQHVTAPMLPAASVSASAPAAAPAAAKAPASNQKQVVSPFVGTFYRAGSPTAEPYCREGQSVKRGDVLCIIEAMKLMNEIEAEFPGKIVSVLVENGQPVEFGEPLFLVET